MHNLLKRQLRRFFGEGFVIPARWEGFVQAVNEAYSEFDQDRRLLERSLDLSSQELLQANSEMRAVFRAFPDMFFWLDAEGRILNSQIGLETDLCIPREELVGRRIQEVAGGSAAERFDLAIREALDRRTVAGIEYSMKVRGSLRHCEARLVPLMEQQVLAIIRDITERKRTETEFLEEKERLAVTLASIKDGVITTDNDGRVVLMNGVAEGITGWKQAEAAGLPLEEVCVIRGMKGNPEARSGCGGGVPAAGDPQLRIYTVATRNGDEVVVSETRAPIRDTSGREIGTILVLRDITVQERMEEELFRARKLESLGVLAGGIAHDFNNILTAVIGNISLARMRCQPDSDVHSILSRAEKAGARARSLTHQLLTFSKGGAPVKRTASVDELVRETADFALRGSGVLPEFALAGNLWPVEIDEGQISQVVNNIVINAMQAMPSGGTVRISMENTVLSGGNGAGSPSLPPGRYVRISIADRGIGIAPEHISRIFDPYFTTKPKGSGLGLATSYSIIRKHGGDITFTTRLGKGTIFSLYLPASAGIDASPTPCEPREAPAVRSGKGRVLLMDDEEGIRDVGGAMLKQLGYDVECALDGERLLALHQEAKSSGRPFDIVIMDLTVPGGMGGKEAIRRLRAIDPDVRVIVSTGYSEDPVLASYRDHGFDSFVIKPYTIGDFSQALNASS